MRDAPLTPSEIRSRVLGMKPSTSSASPSKKTSEPNFGLDLEALRPKLPDVYLGGDMDSSKPSNILDRLLDMSGRKRAYAEASAAVAGRKREQEEQGLRSYAPNNINELADELSTRLLGSKLGGSVDDAFFKNKRAFNKKIAESKTPWTEETMKERDRANMADLAGAQITRRPSGGVIVRTPEKAIVTSRYGTGVYLPKAAGEKTIEGIPASQWYAQTAARQGANNKFATALPTGKKDELGREKFRGIAFEDSDKMSPEKQKALIYEAMNRKKA
jgi:hypothetical protein